MQGKEAAQIGMIEALIRELLQKMREEEGLEKKREGERVKRKMPSETEELYEEDDAILTQEGMHECLEEVEDENKYQEAEDVDQEVEDKDKEQKGVESVQFASSEATPPNLPSELHFKWVNPYYMNCLGRQRYGLIETNGQLKALCGVLNKKKMESMELNESEFKACSGLLHKLHNNRAKTGWVNRVWDLGKSFMDHHFWEVTHCMGALRSLNPQGIQISNIGGNSMMSSSTSLHNKIFQMSNLKDNKQKCWVGDNPPCCAYLHEIKIRILDYSLNS
ncbi:hypothetical protein PIB30_061181 [Stylosanthes scabra]|uniref:Uncharacterized protein n=1 Tax=Stylosanthes scabra TaxID=79078 RepID=A0ABU6SL58_9FABA|nr:hypothetical protein [Stylosanthes scabra]